MAVILTLPPSNFQRHRSKNGQWKLIHFDGPDEHSAALSPVSLCFALCNRRPQNYSETEEERERLPTGGSTWAGTCGLNCGSLNHRRPRRFHVQFTDYKLAPHIFVSGLATFTYIVIAVILLSSSPCSSLQRNNYRTPNYYYFFFFHFITRQQRYNISPYKNITCYRCHSRSKSPKDNNINTGSFNELYFERNCTAGTQRVIQQPFTPSASPPPPLIILNHK